MVERLKDVMVNAGAAWVLWLLFGLSIVSVGIMIERGRLFLSRRDDIAALLADLHRLFGRPRSGRGPSSPRSIAKRGGGGCTRRP